MNWFKSIPIEIILKKMLKDHLSKINVIDCVLTHEPSIYIFIKVKRWKPAIKWCKFYFDINFFLLKNYTKITTQFMTTHLMGADANPFSQSTYMISKNCPFFPKTLTKETTPNIWVSNYEISDGVNPLSSHIHTYLM